MANSGKPLVWLEGEIKTPPFSRAARLEAGFLLRRLQLGEQLSLPQSRPMPSIGRAPGVLGGGRRRERHLAHRLSH